MSEPVAGNHNDLYEIKTSTNDLFEVLEEADIATEGLFINADADHRGADLMRKASGRSAKKKVLFLMLLSTSEIVNKHISMY